MVTVKYFKTEGRTNELMYSINEGVDWKQSSSTRNRLR